MFVVLLKFSANKAEAPTHMADHNSWLAQGFDENIFLVAGSLKPSQGGAILAHNCTLEALQNRVNADPFVQEDIVTAEILEIAPSKVDERFSFLLD